MRRTLTTTTTTTTTTGRRSRIYDDFDDSNENNDEIHNIPNNDIFMSDRIQRWIETLSLDIDDDDDDDDTNNNDDHYPTTTTTTTTTGTTSRLDEIHITSTGQTIPIQDLRNNIFSMIPKKQDHHNDNNDPGYSIRNTNVNDKTNNNNHQQQLHRNTETDRTTGGIMIQTSSTLAIVLMLCGSCCYYYYYCVGRRRSSKEYSTVILKPHITPSTTETRTINSTNAITPPTMAVDVVSSSSSKHDEESTTTTTKMINNSNEKDTTNDDSNIPTLVREENVDDTVDPNDTTQTNETEQLLPKQDHQTHTLPTLPMSIIPAPTTTTSIVATPNDSADHVLTLVSTLREKCQLQNMECDTSTIWQWAIQQQMTHQQIQAQTMIQLRQLMHEETQQTIHRSIQQQHHQETITLHREDPNWLFKLNTVRNKCQETILRTMYQCCIGVLVTVLIQPVIFVIQVYTTSSSMTEFFCYNTGTIYDPTNIRISQSYNNSNNNHHHKSSYYEYYFSWYDRYASAFTYIDSYTILAMGDGMTCVTYTLGRLMFVVGVLLVWYVVSWMFHQITGNTPHVQFIGKSMFVWYLLSIYDWIPTMYLYRMMMSFGIILSLCYGTVTYQYYTMRNKFRNTKEQILPQITDVNEAIVWFDDMIHHLQILPIVTVGGLLIMLLTST